MSERTDEFGNIVMGTAATPGTPPEEVQYRLKAVQSKRKKAKFAQWFGCCGGFYEDKSQLDDSRWTVNQLVMRYLHWTFRSSFGLVFLSSCVGFLLFTTLFAVLIMVLGQQHPECIGGIGGEDGDQYAWYMDSFVLSWTTFSTVVSKIGSW